MEPFRVECKVEEEDHCFFAVDSASISLEPHLYDNSGYLCMNADKARALAAWLLAAADTLDPPAESRHPD